MLAARLPSILPPLSPAELLEVSMIARSRRNRRRGAYQPGPFPARRIIPLHAGAGRRRLARQSRARFRSRITACLFLDEFPEICAAGARFAAPSL